MHPSSHAGSNMKWYTISWRRPSNSSASVFFPLGPSKTYDLVTFFPRQLAALPAQLVTEPGELLFLCQEDRPLVDPLVVRHHAGVLGGAALLVAIRSSLGLWGWRIGADPRNILPFG